MNLKDFVTIVILADTQKGIKNAEIFRETHENTVLFIEGDLHPSDSWKILRRFEAIKEQDTPVVLLGSEASDHILFWSEKLEQAGISYDHLNFYVEKKYNAAYLLAMKKYHYIDSRKNQIQLSPDIDLVGTLEIGFLAEGKNNKVEIGKIRVRKSVEISTTGNDGLVSIGDDTAIFQTNFVCGQNGKIIVGKDCLFSHTIDFSQNDKHHIFDAKTGRRLNWTKDIVIGNHVWLGRKVELLGGAHIGSGSMVGSNCVTSSTFPENVIIAGNPGRIIRRDILWTRDGTYTKQYENYEDCQQKVTSIPVNIQRQKPVPLIKRVVKKLLNYKHPSIDK